MKIWLTAKTTHNCKIWCRWKIKLRKNFNKLRKPWIPKRKKSLNLKAKPKRTRNRYKIWPYPWKEWPKKKPSSNKMSITAWKFLRMKVRSGRMRSINSKNKMKNWKNKYNLQIKSWYKIKTKSKTIPMKHRNW